MTSSAQSRSQLATAASKLDFERFARPALAVAVVASGLLIFHFDRGSSFSVDDWTWVESRRAITIHTFLAPYNGHLSVVPIAIYRLMFAVFGIGSFVPYRLLLFVVASATGVAVFEYARHRVGELGAVVAATLLLFVGPGWNDIMQPFQIAWLVAIAGGVLALSLLDRRRPGADVAACILLLVSIASTSVGVALTIGVAVDVALTRHRWRDAWIVAAPLALYALWAANYHPTGLQLSALTSLPLNLAQTVAAGVAGVVGLSGVTPIDLVGQAVGFGAVLLALVAGAAIARSRMGWDATRFCSLTVALVVFTLLTTVARSFQSPLESRYMYVCCVLMTLMALELVRGLQVSRPAQAGAVVLTLIAVVSNVGVLESGGAYFRQIGGLADATFGAVQLDRGSVSATTLLPLYPLGSITAGQYFSAADALGTPADTTAQLEHADPAAQSAADAQLIADRDVTFTGVTTLPPPAGVAPVIQGGEQATTVVRGPCAIYAPVSVLPPYATSSVWLRLAGGYASVQSGSAQTALSLRRFAPTFSAPVTVHARGAVVVWIKTDRAPQPWYLQVQSTGSVSVCAVSRP